MKIEQRQLIDDLQRRTKDCIGKVQQFKSLNQKQLNWKSAPDSWSILECLEHLNLYGDFYLVEIENRILKAPKSQHSLKFKSGFLGNYFAQSMLPKKGKIKKMKTFKDKNPLNSELSFSTLERFLKQQEKMLNLLEEARKLDLMKCKTAISISKWIKLQLGDTFRVVIYHNERHILQAKNVIQKMQLP
ncbi:DinB family protein [Xanthovirga aplysinae]|uniref:DinB family protein n=1 Tax=Xanthovirga aplysinae TaxID=2529853 RepID=UPI0012BB82C8|nr:DinB family protein [Xanthovirga aplysinae]MTI31603.1 DinB family protein [Xanthovirga aplysinae]